MDTSEKTVNETVREITALLAPKYGAGEAKAMARIIFENLKGWSAVDLAIKANEHLTVFMEGKIMEVVKRVLADEPIQYIFGVADFYGMKLRVTPDTLIPRPETAELVDVIVKDNQQKDLRVIDIGTGSGCIAIALSRNLPFAHVTATDISRKALDVAQENARSLKCDINFIENDILDGKNLPEADGCFDIIVSNPPYIAEKERADMDKNVTEFEPASALFVPDGDPLKFYSAELDFGQQRLCGGGRIYFEINPVYASELKAMASAKGYGNVEVWRDSYGKERFMSASKN